MPRQQPPPHVRWIAQDAIRDCDTLKEALDRLTMGMLKGARMEEALPLLQHMRRRLDEMRDRMKCLMVRISAEDLVAYVLDDETTMILLRARMRQDEVEQEALTL